MPVRQEIGYTEKRRTIASDFEEKGKETLMGNILKAMKISGIIALFCLLFSIAFQTYVYMNYREVTTETNSAIKAVGQIVTYTYQYQLTAYKNTFNKQDYIDYDTTYKTCLEGMGQMLEVIDNNKAIKQVEQTGELVNVLKEDISTLTSQKNIVDIDDSVTSSIVSQASMITTLLEINRENRQKVLANIEIFSSVFSLVLFCVCFATVEFSQKYAKSAEEEYEEKVMRENYTDGLTGLMNQKYVTQVLPGIVEKNASGYLYMFDMDNFKKLNDTCGHAAGDKALKGFAEVMLSSVRENDIPCRFGGDEFILYASGLENDKDAISLAKRIQNSTKQKFAGTQLDIVAISCGIAPVIKNRPYNRLKNDADQALYYVKEHEKGTCHMSKKRKSAGRRKNETPARENSKEQR